MRAHEHTSAMLAWWHSRGIGLVDVAVRRPSGVMCWHHAIAISAVPLAWIRAENVHRADVYIRPARIYAWPLIFLDDVDPAVAARLGTRVDLLRVRTSAAGGCHVWLHTRRELSEPQRAAAQRHVAVRIGADSRSTSGEHLGRLAGLKNWKRDGNWVNVLPVISGRPPWDPDDLALPDRAEHSPSAPCMTSCPVDPEPPRDTSESGREWGWVCGALEAGIAPADICAQLTERARKRRGRGADRYAERTVAKALRRNR